MKKICIMMIGIACGIYGTVNNQSDHLAAMWIIFALAVLARE